MVYSSTDNKFIKEIKKLNTKKFRDLEDKFIVEGEHLVKEAFLSKHLLFTISLEDYESPYLIDNKYVTERVMNYISELETPQPVIGICKKTSSNIIGERVLILDGIQDPGNLGTIIRSAVAFNIDTILLSKDTVDLYNSKVIRASQGMIFYINIMSVNLYDTLDDLIKGGYRIIGTKVDNGKDIKEMSKATPFALIMGNEGNGVRIDILEKCNEFAHIVMKDDCESLNVAVATSIILYELSK